MYRYGFTALEGVEGVKGVVGTVGKVIDRLTLPAREKRQLEAELLELLVETSRRWLDPALRRWWKRPGETGCSDHGGRW